MGFDCIYSLSFAFYLLCLFLLCSVYKLIHTEFPITKIGREFSANNFLALFTILILRTTSENSSE